MARQRILIDTSILIDYLRKKRKDKTRFFELIRDYDCVISSITEFEFLVGSRPKSHIFTQTLLAKLPVLPFDSACAEKAVEIHRKLKAKNQLISLLDTFIGATAIVHDLPLQTLNRKHFERIENLELDL